MNGDSPHGRDELASAFDGRRDEAAFRDLYRRLTPGLYRVALGWLGGRREAAEDAVQEAWVRAVRGWSRFHGTASLRTWLTGIVLRCCWEETRRGARRREEPLGEPAPPPPPDAALRLDLLRQVGSLPRGYREVLLLHDVEGFTHAEIGDLLGIGEGTSKSQLFRARRALRGKLEGRGASGTSSAPATNPEAGP